MLPLSPEPAGNSVSGTARRRSSRSDNSRRGRAARSAAPVFEHNSKLALNQAPVVVNGGLGASCEIRGVDAEGLLRVDLSRRWSFGRMTVFGARRPSEAQSAMAGFHA